MGQRGTVRAGIIFFFLRKRNENNQPCIGIFFCNRRIVSVDKREDFVRDRISCTALRGRWCNIIVLNVHAPGQEKSDDSKHSFYEELQAGFR